MKNQVKQYWNDHVCGTGGISQIEFSKFSRAYFREVYRQRHMSEQGILDFIDLSQLKGKKLLEVGVGAGTDFVQFAVAGAEVYGIDLTESAIEHTKKWMELENLEAADLRVADCEALPYESNTFDIVYSWGVVHHTPDTWQAIKEIIRVTKPGGEIKLMVYNRRSVKALRLWVVYALLRRKPFSSISDVLWKHQESIGTKAFTMSEIKEILDSYMVRIKSITAPVRQLDYCMGFLPFPFSRLLSFLVILVLGFNKAGWFMRVSLEKL